MEGALRCWTPHTYIITHILDGGRENKSDRWKLRVEMRRAVDEQDTYRHTQCCCFSLNFSLDRVRCCVHNSRLFSGPLEPGSFLALLPLRSIRKERRPLVLGGQPNFSTRNCLPASSSGKSILINHGDLKWFFVFPSRVCPALFSFLFNRKKARTITAMSTMSCSTRNNDFLFPTFFFLFSLIWNDHKFCYRFWQYFFKSDRPGRLNQAEPLNSTF